MSEEQRQSSFRQEFEAHLNSPLPLLMRLRNFIFGTATPDSYTRFSFFLALITWIIFFTWSVVGAIALRMREVIVDNKAIDVTELISKRGIALGFEPAVFISNLELFSVFSIICWIGAFIGLVLMWRKKLIFIYFFLSGCLLYLISMWILLGFSYYSQDTTFFDKIAFALLVGHTSAYAYFLKREKDGNKIQLFGIEDED